MRIPNDTSLTTWIRRLIQAGKVALFYHTEDWKELREDVLQYFHYECVECAKHGRYTRADCVHHVNHVTKRPDLALSRYYIDSKGKQQYNLVPLCNECHNKVHPEKLQRNKDKEKFTNEERW